MPEPEQVAGGRHAACEVRGADAGDLRAGKAHRVEDHERQAGRGEGVDRIPCAARLVEELLRRHDYVPQSARRPGGAATTVELLIHGGFGAYATQVIEGVVHAGAEVGASIVVGQLDDVRLADDPPHGWARRLATGGRAGVIVVTASSPAPSGGGAVVVVGEAGAGKTALLSRAAAGASGFRMLWVHGARSESVLPFAAAADLLLPLREHFGRLPVVQRHALEVVLALRSGPVPAPLAACAAGHRLPRVDVWPAQFARSAGGSYAWHGAEVELIGTPRLVDGQLVLAGERWADPIELAPLDPRAKVQWDAARGTPQPTTQEEVRPSTRCSRAGRSW
ncbi:hypothetical protein [Pseudonocardia nigra]|uniref:hypothetical protein n=1 Tax=Pseudonocardia nigra TaxID=1921578 RepID=UPI001C5FDB16